MAHLTYFPVTQSQAKGDQGGDVREFVARREALFKSHLLRLSKQAGFVLVNDDWVHPKKFTRKSLYCSLLRMLHTVEILLIIMGICGLSYALFVFLDYIAG